MDDPGYGPLVVISLIVAYFLPSIVAFLRKHRSIWAIVFINVFLSFTIIGWLVAMIWSLTGYVREDRGA